ncbi:MAG TPA: DEAD/DEAH box helicase [Acidobacteriota bacterium]|jgi:hypothetical protein
MILGKDEPENQEEPRKERKKPYNVPKLTTHGTVEDITRAGINGVADGVLIGSTI